LPCYQEGGLGIGRPAVHLARRRSGEAMSCARRGNSPRELCVHCAYSYCITKFGLSLGRNSLAPPSLKPNIHRNADTHFTRTNYHGWHTSSCCASTHMQPTSHDCTGGSNPQSLAGPDPLMCSMISPRMWCFVGPKPFPQASESRAACSHGRHCHSTLSSTVIAYGFTQSSCCHCYHFRSK
jgi:hypothetical protein